MDYKKIKKEEAAKAELTKEQQAKIEEQKQKVLKELQSFERSWNLDWNGQQKIHFLFNLKKQLDQLVNANNFLMHKEKERSGSKIIKPGMQ